MVWAVNTETADFRKHTKYGWFELRLNPNGVVGDPNVNFSPLPSLKPDLEDNTVETAGKVRAPVIMPKEDKPAVVKKIPAGLKEEVEKEVK